jgi:hypothetical protein
VIVAGFLQAEALQNLADVGFEGLGTEVEPGGNGGPTSERSRMASIPCS